MKPFLPLSMSLVLVSLTLACPTAPPDEGEGEGEGGGEGEGEPVIDFGAPPVGYATTPPAGAGEACSAQQWWILGDRESEAMHPGGDCIGCHADRGEGPRLQVAGTVQARVDDETDCRGVEGVLVELLDAQGTVFLSLTTNRAGNFFASSGLTGNTPYTARLTYEGRTREMSTPQTDGNCMSCHTAAGESGAPGRIQVP